MTEKQISNRWLQYAIDNAEAWLDNCEECRPIFQESWLCDQCKFWKRELALLHELKERREQDANA